MIRYPGAIWMVRDPVDMRRGIEGLSEVVRQSLGKNPCTDGGPGSKYYCGMGRGFGCSKGGCIRVGLFGRWKVIRPLP